MKISPKGCWTGVLRSSSRIVKNLVKGVKSSFSLQVIANAAKINLQSVTYHPPSKCYSEYRE